MHTFWQRRENHHRPEVSVVFPFLLLCEELVPHCLKSQHLKQQIRMTKFYNNKKMKCLFWKTKILFIASDWQESQVESSVQKIIACIMN